MKIRLRLGRRRRKRRGLPDHLQRQRIDGRGAAGMQDLEVDHLALVVDREGDDDLAVQMSGPRLLLGALLAAQLAEDDALVIVGLDLAAPGQDGAEARRQHRLVHGQRRRELRGVVALLLGRGARRRLVRGLGVGGCRGRDRDIARRRADHLRSLWRRRRGGLLLEGFRVDRAPYWPPWARSAASRPAPLRAAARPSWGAAAVSALRRAAVERRPLPVWARIRASASPKPPGSARAGLCRTGYRAWAGQALPVRDPGLRPPSPGRCPILREFG